MTDSLLTLLQIRPEQILHLSSKQSNRLFNFLLDWEAYHEALVCLAHLNVERSVTLQDLHARALNGLGRSKEAIQVMEARLRKRKTLTAQGLLIRGYLQNDNSRTALKQAKMLTKTSPHSSGAWALLGDTYLYMGNLHRAEDAYFRHQELTPNSPESLVGLMRVYHRCGDRVTSTAYAVRAHESGSRRKPIPIHLLQELLDFFVETGDGDRSQDASQQLNERFACELDELQKVLHTTGDGISTRNHVSSKTEKVSRRAPREKRIPLQSVPPSAPAPTPPDLSKIEVSHTERKSLEQAARDLYGFTELLPAQTEIMACTRRGGHVLAILPTGAGKSLCYQLPAFMDEGTTLVVSPLIALMKDQVDSLPRAVRSQAIAINSSLDGKALQREIEAIRYGHYKLVYAAPERLRQLPFVHALRQGNLVRLVIDEAHCVSSWGHDFRPDYLHIAQVHRDLGAPPILALTATAPQRIREDITRQLFAEHSRSRKRPTKANFRLIATDTFRPNLVLETIQTHNEEEKQQQLANLCLTLSQNGYGCGIVYARTRHRCEELAEILRQKGLHAEHYHAGIADRSVLQDRFMRNEIRIIVATIAFGMGVDKPDIRFIIHYRLPDSIESYYQEVGRAGRDGKIARCVLLHSHHDKHLLERFASESVISTDFLRKTYKVVCQQLKTYNPGTVNLEELCRKLKGNDTDVRVTLSVLEQTNLLDRSYDAPSSISLLQSKPNKDTTLNQFVNRAELPFRHPREYNFLQLAEKTKTSATRMEAQLLQRQEAGLLHYYPRGREALLILLPYSENAYSRIQSLLDQYATIQQQRVNEIVNYTQTRQCRHGYLANYLGGEPRMTCNVCDNCSA